MSKALRLSPSGPVIGNVGPGFLLRMVDARAGLTTLQEITTVALAVGTLTIELGNPDPSKYYGAQLYMDADNVISNSVATAFAYIQASYNGGTNWASVVGSSHPIAAAGSVARGGFRQISATVPIGLGSAAPWSIPPGTTSIQLRPAIQASVASTLEVTEAQSADYPNIYLALMEYANP